MTTITPFSRAWGRPGGGPRVLLVHGLSSYSGTWWRVATELADRGCHVVAPDLRGHGLSPSTTRYTFEAMAEDLTFFGSDWDLVVGHSLAGPIVVELAMEPDRCQGLLLLDPLLDVPDDGFDELVSELLSELAPDATSESVRSLHPEWDPEDCFHKAVGARTTSPFVVEACLRDNAPYHHLGMLDQLSVATTILGSDPVCGALFHPDSMSRIDNTRVSYRQLEGTGHSIQRDRPDLVVREAISALS